MSGNIGGGTADASIPLQAGRGTTQPENPLQMVGQFANVQNALNANRLFPGQLQQQQQGKHRGRRRHPSAAHQPSRLWGHGAALCRFLRGRLTYERC